MGNLANYKMVAPGAINVINLSNGDIMASLRLSSFASDKLNRQYVENVTNTVENYLSYINKPNCQVSIWHTIFSSVGIAPTGNNGCKVVTIKATGTPLASINFYNVDGLFNLSLENGVAHACEVYMAGIERYQKSLATDKVMENRRQTVRNLMRR